MGFINKSFKMKAQATRDKRQGTRLVP